MVAHLAVLSKMQPAQPLAGNHTQQTREWHRSHGTILICVRLPLLQHPALVSEMAALPAMKGAGDGTDTQVIAFLTAIQEELIRTSIARRADVPVIQSGFAGGGRKRLAGH